MRSIHAVTVLLAILTSPASAQLVATFGPRGEVAELRVGDVVYFTDLAVSVTKPGWSGTVVDQRAADLASVKVIEAGGITTYTSTLTGAEGTVVQFHEVARVAPDSLTLEYELTADREISVERVLLHGIIPSAVHAGKTRYLVADAGRPQGLLPVAEDPLTHLVVGSRVADWFGLLGPQSFACRVTPSGLLLQLQDERRWGLAGYGLLAMSDAQRLLPGQPVRLAITFTARDRSDMEADLRAIAQSDLAGLPRPDNRPLAFRSVTVDKPSVPAYSCVELSADIAATYTNPFDPDEIRVDADVTTPGGAVVTIPGFYLIPVSLETTMGTERVRVTGPSGFRVRYTPTEPGEYRVVLQAGDRNGAVSSAPINFVATPSDHPGFVRRAKDSPQYLVLDSGQSYFAIGENMAWSSSATPVADYEKWLRGLGAAGGNWARLFLSYAEKGQEWSAPPTPRPGQGTYLGLGRYAQDTSARLDEIVRLADEHGVRLMFCIGAYMEFYHGGFFNEGAWVSNPYNAANGGPCATADDFWINPEARRLYKQRLRYLIARWGHSPTLFAWEFWNEVPATPAEEAWIVDMAAYLKRHDPNRHLVSTTYGAAATWECPDVDFSMKHIYGAANIVDFTPLLAQQAEECLRFGKPYLPAEFGVDWQTGDDRWDPRRTGINMHNGAWASLASGAAGTAMLWYWDSYVHPSDLYRVLTPVRKFADTIDWATTRFSRLAGLEVRLSDATPEEFSDLMIPGTLEWGVTPSNEYTARRDGSVLGGPVTVTLASPGRGNPAELFTEMTWHVDMPSAGTVLVKLGHVSTAARLHIRVDGELRVDRPLVSGEPGKGPWKSSRYLEQYKLWISNYDEDIPFEVAAGSHDITIANAEGDWLQVRCLTLPAYRSSRFPQVNVMGLQSDRLLILWLHNQESTWRTEFDGKQPREFTDLRLSVPMSAEGEWKVEWWDTFTGEVLRAEQVPSHDGKLALEAPRFNRDLALRIERVR